jgi:2-oxoglutarate/2-oxoacid ferredoxin oxidoreductase subunit alpha
VYECFEFGWKAFDVAERIQTPVFVLSDLDMGMNQWMSKPFQYPDTPMDRGKVLFEKDLEELKGNWGRYFDKDGDGVGYRTLAGNKHPLSAYLARGTGHDEYAKYSEEAPVYVANMERLKKKQETAKQYIPAPMLHKTKGATVGIIAYGSTEAAVLETQYLLNRDHGIKSDFLRVRALPFTKEVDAFLKKYDQIFVVEMNRDGQMDQILKVEYPQFAVKFKSVALTDGLPASAKWILEGILEKHEKASDQKAVISKKKTVVSKKKTVNVKKAAKPSAKKKPAVVKSKAKRK